MNLPVYKVHITDDKYGIDKISLVEYPAFKVNFLAFSNDKKQVMLTVDNEEQRIITGVVARCDYPIYRNQDGYEFYITFDKEVIEEMAMKLLADNHQNNVNIEHKSNSDVDGVIMREIFIKDSSKGVNPKGFEDISDGSLFATYKVFNDDVWNAVKDGTYKGFSLEGIFELTEAKTDEDKTLDEIMDILNKIENKIKNK